jgi:hypothetical protein
MTPSLSSDMDAKRKDRVSGPDRRAPCDRSPHIVSN